jgi:metal-dependent hydrolase (beta-lactamase superfamily II)
MWTLLSFHNPNLWDQGFLSETTAVFVWQQHMLSLSGFHLLNWLKLKLLKHVISFALELGVGIVFACHSFQN